MDKWTIEVIQAENSLPVIEYTGCVKGGIEIWKTTTNTVMEWQEAYSLGIYARDMYLDNYKGKAKYFYINVY